MDHHKSGKKKPDVPPEVRELAEKISNFLFFLQSQILPLAPPEKDKYVKSLIDMVAASSPPVFAMYINIFIRPHASDDFTDFLDAKMNDFGITQVPREVRDKFVRYLHYFCDRLK